MKKPVVDLSNKNISEIEIPDSIFGIKVFPDLIHQYIRYQNAKSRQGSHTTKTRSEISGRSKKPFAQKGTGNARQGSSKPPHFRGGAISMGPQNRDHSFSLNKKEKSLALKCALSNKANKEEIIFINSLEMKDHKTKNLFSDLKNFNYKSALFIYSDNEKNLNFQRASSNIPRLAMLSDKGLNVKDLMTFDKIFIETKSVEEITKRFS
jgi:large subunit ribosomal protein L4